MCPITGHSGFLKATTQAVQDEARSQFEQIALSLPDAVYGDWSKQDYRRRVLSSLTQNHMWVHPLQAEIFIATAERLHFRELEELGLNTPNEDLSDDAIACLENYCRWWFFPIRLSHSKPLFIHAVRRRDRWSMFTTDFTPGYPVGTAELGVGVMLFPNLEP